MPKFTPARPEPNADDDDDGLDPEYAEDADDVVESEDKSADERLAEVEAQLDEVQGENGHVAQRLAGVEERVGRVDRVVAALSDRVSAIEAALSDFKLRVIALEQPPES